MGNTILVLDEDLGRMQDFLMHIIINEQVRRGAWGCGGLASAQTPKAERVTCRGVLAGGAACRRAQVPTGLGPTLYCFKYTYTHAYIHHEDMCVHIQITYILDVHYVSNIHIHVDI